MVPANDAGAPIPLADGAPISSAIADQAAEWLTLLMSGDASEQERQAWHQWRAAHADHERAWQHIEIITGHIKVLQPDAVYQTLSPFVSHDGVPHLHKRRKVLEFLMLGGIVSTTGLFASRTQTFQQLVADYKTGTGEQRSFVLDDGTQITLNTASSVELDFTSKYRLVRLVAGEALITTGHASGAQVTEDRPFIVQTAQGRIRALGTQFTVRQHDGHTQVAVLESAVEVSPHNGGAVTVRIQSGEQASFTLNTITTTQPLAEQTIAWSRGQILADNLRLGDFVADLNRYRPGVLRCDPAVADLRLSGVFPLQDIDRILATLSQVLPVQVVKRTGYWVTIQAAPQ